MNVNTEKFILLCSRALLDSTYYHSRPESKKIIIWSKKNIKDGVYDFYKEGLDLSTAIDRHRSNIKFQILKSYTTHIIEREYVYYDCESDMIILTELGFETYKLVEEL